MFWSTNDARRQCVYTCRIVLVNPENRSASRLKQDQTIVHDPEHPEYNETLDLQYTGVLLKPSESSASIDTIDVEADSECDIQTTTCSRTVENITFLNVPNQRDIKNKQNITKSSKPSSPNLSASWPPVAARRSLYEDSRNRSSEMWSVTPSPPPVSRLVRPLSAPHYTPRNTDVSEENDELGLLAVVNRLNNAAARNRRRSRESRESSAERSSRESSLSREGRNSD